MLFQFSFFQDAAVVGPFEDSPNKSYTKPLTLCAFVVLRRCYGGFPFSVPFLIGPREARR